MVWLDRDPSGNFHICFRLGARKFKRSLRIKDERRANASCSRVEENIRLVELGRLDLPAGVDIATFLLSDGMHLRSSFFPSLMQANASKFK